MENNLFLNFDGKTDVNQRTEESSEERGKDFYEKVLDRSLK